MKILFVLPAYEPAWAFGGVVRCMSNLCRGLAVLGDEITVFTTNANGAGQALDVPTGVPVELGGVKVFYFPSTFGPGSVWDSRSLVRQLKQQVVDYDIVYVSAVWQWLGYEATKICQAYDIPVVFGVHGSLNARLLRNRRLKKALYWRFVLRKALQRASVIHYTTTYERTGSREIGVPSFIVPNGLDTGEFERVDSAQDIRQRFGIPDDAPLVLTVGRIHPIKRLELLINALPLADNVYLAIVGPDDTPAAKKYKDLCRELQVEARVIWMGYQAGSDLVAIYSAGDIYASLSEHENFGMTVVEAMACGLPILVSSQVGVWYEVEDAKPGKVVEASPEAIAASLRSFVETPMLWRRWSENAQRIAQERFANDKVAELMHVAFEDVLTGQRSPQCKWMATHV